MPRSTLAGSSNTASSPSPADYFESLRAFADRVSAPTPKSDQVPLTKRREDRSETGRLVVCHDYKGGYSENEFERGYTFNHWHLCDTYIYFSHHRISLPPPALVRTAHRHGTRVLGTLIFEWDAGREDIIELVDPGADERTTNFDRLSLKYADLLVDLADERGIDGWLVNVEVELGGQRDASGQRRGAKEHARLLLGWLTYFKNEMHKRIPGSEVMWYDAVTLEGKLQWQNSLTDANVPFLHASDSIFLNYFWTPNQIASTLAMLSRFPTLSKRQVHFGIDVFGRGSYGGGGFETWRALEAIRETDPSLSIALFAPGWTVESEDLKHSLNSKEDYAEWFRDEMYFWSNGPATARVPAELARMRKLRQDQAGAHRARQLALALRRDPRIPLSYRAPVEPLSFNLRTIPDPPGSYRPISHFFPSPRPAPTLDGTFYTNFSSGSGNSFFVNGRELVRSETGWTDLDYHFPFPSLLFQRPVKGYSASFAEESGQVWQGNRSIKLEVAPSTISTELDLFSVDYPIIKGGTYHATVVWRSVEHFEHPNDGKLVDLDISPRLAIFVSTSNRGGEDVTRLDQSKQRSPLECDVGDPSDGWRSTTIVFDSDRSGQITKLAISQLRPSSFFLGSVSITPAPTSDGARPEIEDVGYSNSIGELEWSTSIVFRPPAVREEYVVPADPNRLEPPSFTQYYVFRRRLCEAKDELQKGKEAQREKDEYLGTTRQTHFAVARDIVAGHSVVVRGVGADETAFERTFEIKIE